MSIKHATIENFPEAKFLKPVYEPKLLTFQIIKSDDQFLYNAFNRPGRQMLKNILTFLQCIIVVIAFILELGSTFMRNLIKQPLTNLPSFYYESC